MDQQISAQQKNSVNGPSAQVADPTAGYDGERPIHSGETAQYISFTIGNEEYGVDIMAVREIKGWTNTTPLPNTPDYMVGVLNLRGVIVPVFDLRCRFNEGRTKATDKHVFIIVAVGDRTIGILVDAVSDILTVSANEILAVPSADRAIDDVFLTGLVTVKNRMVALLELEHLFDPQSVPEVDGSDVEALN